MTRSWQLFYQPIISSLSQTQKSFHIFGVQNLEISLLYSKTQFPSSFLHFLLTLYIFFTSTSTSLKSLKILYSCLPSFKTCHSLSKFIHILYLFIIFSFPWAIQIPPFLSLPTTNIYTHSICTHPRPIFIESDYLSPVRFF